MSLSVLDLFYSPSCLVCGEKVISHKERICLLCDPDFPRKHQDDLRSRLTSEIPKNACRYCGEISISNLDSCLCCLATPLSVDYLISVWRYSSKIERLLKAIKYKNAHPLIKQLAKRVYQLLENEFLANNWDLVVPVPSSRQAVEERGYQHVSLFARELTRLGKLKMAYDLLYMIEGLEGRQAVSPISSRVSNIKGRIKAKKRDLEGMRILLVDDIVTTGATIDESAKALKERGAIRVEALSIARSINFTENRMLSVSTAKFGLS